MPLKTQITKLLFGACHMFLFAVIHAICFAVQAHAVPESSFQQVHGLIRNDNDFYSLSEFSGKNNVKIGYTKFGSTQGPRGCLVISSGRTEAGIKYLELAHDLAKVGFGPIFAIDHRGQGFSDRLLDDHDKGYVAYFSDYIDDFEVFMSDVVLADSRCRESDVFLLAHSLGGAIAAGYLEMVGGRNPFKKVVLSSPMLKIAFADGTTEDSAIRKTWLACNTPIGPKCSAYVPGGGPYNPDRDFNNPAHNGLTNSRVRFNFYTDLNSKWPEIRLGSPTVNWVYQSASTNRAIRKLENVKLIQAPVLILQATNDSVVDNAGQVEFCQRLPGCTLVKINGAQHEILMETDSMRNQAINRILGFFN